MFVFFCKQKTAYEVRISDWSSDVCSSDLSLDRYDGLCGAGQSGTAPVQVPAAARQAVASVSSSERMLSIVGLMSEATPGIASALSKSPSIAEIGRQIVMGKIVSVRVSVGGRRIIKKKRKIQN